MRYIYGAKRKGSIKNKLVALVAVLALTANSFSTALPALFLNSKVAAATAITPVSMGNWLPVTTTGGTVSFVAISGAPSGSGAAKLVTTNDNDSRARLTTSEFSGIPLADVTEASYWSNAESASNAAGSVSYSITIDVDGNLGTVGDQVSLNHEPYWQNGGSPDPAPVVHGEWQEWDVDEGLFWARGAAYGFNSDPGGPPLYSLADAKTIAPNAKVVSVSVYIGSYNPSYITLVDLVSLNGTVYDFEPYSHTPPAAAAQTTQTVLQSQFANAMNTWTYQNDNTSAANPNATANHEIVANPTPSPGDMGAVRLTADTGGERWNLASLQYSGKKLADIAALGFGVYTNSPGKAYINLDVDFNHPGLNGWQGRLVYVPTGVANNIWSSHEAVASNGQWMWSRMVTGAVSTWPDGSTAASRSWKDIVSAFPEARITAIDNAAFGSLYLRSDGPAVTYYDNVFLATSTENIKYNFELPDTTKPVVNLATPTVGSVNPAQIVVEATDETSLYRVTANIYNAANTTLLHSCSQLAGNTTSYTLTCPVPGLPDGTYTIRANAQDNASPRHTANTITRQFTVDHTAPAVPVHESPSDNAVQNFNDFYFEWTDVEGAVEYEFQSATSSATDESGALTTGVWNNKLHGGLDRNHLTDSNIHSYGANGTWYWQVRAIDAAGNKSAWTTPWKMTIDMSAPAWSTSPVHKSPNDNGEVTEGSAILMQWSDATDENGVVYYYQVSSSSAVTGPGGDFTSPIWTFGPLTTSELDATGTALGTYYWHVKACDTAGNCTPWTDPWTGSVVETPAAPLSTPTNGQTLGRQTTGGTGGSNESRPKPAQTTAANFPVSFAATPTTNTGPTSDDKSAATPAEEEDDQTGQTLGAATTAGLTTGISNDAAAGCSKLMGLCWYWWIPIGITVATILYIAFRPRSNQTGTTPSVF